MSDPDQISTHHGVESRDRGHAGKILLSFPQEILDLIMSPLDFDTIKCLRLAAKIFVPGANALLFQDLKVALPHDWERTVAISKNLPLARCVKQLTLVRLPALPLADIFQRFLPDCQEIFPQWSRSKIEEYRNLYQKRRHEGANEQYYLSQAWKTRIYERGDPLPKFCESCEQSTAAGDEELKKFLQSVVEKFEKALLNMPNLRSFVGPVESSDVLGLLANSHRTPNVREHHPPEVFYGFVRAKSGAHWKHSRPYQHDQVLHLMRFFGWRNSLGKRLENIEVEFDCRLPEMQRILKRIGWWKTEPEFGVRSVCSHGPHNYSLFLDSVAEATNVDFTIYTELGRDDVELEFLGGPGQDMVIAAQGVKHLCFKIANGTREYAPDDDDSLMNVWGSQNGKIVTIGLDLSLPKWKDLQILLLNGIQSIAPSFVDLLRSYASRLRELQLIDIVLHVERHEKDPVWWTIFKLIRAQNVNRNLKNVLFSGLIQKAGFVCSKGETVSHGIEYKRFIEDDAYALEYFSEGFASSRVYQLEFRQRIYDFILQRTDYVPEEQDDWDFAYAHVQTCDVHMRHQLCPHENLHWSLLNLLRKTRGKARSKSKNWDANKIHGFVRMDNI
ncbi:uncharacterized protein J3D65DRAFT_380170 [Phyllosticta citribraziliensis]|uniref:F-box domain-containing protein n=1 Tax=Phyllosticta citribraziliensis TaxID=989973 RepID=A0ABR1LRX1_9PEZI